MNSKHLFWHLLFITTIVATTNVHAQNAAGCSGANFTLDSVRANHVWRSVGLPSECAAPIVILGPPSFNGAQPGVMRLRHVTPGGFDVRFQEWTYLDSLHFMEDVAYLALPAGRHIMADGTIVEAGTFSLSNTGRWRNEQFIESFPAPPALFLTLQTFGGSQPVTARARRLSSTGFQAALFEEEALMDGHASETVAYLAIYSASGRGSLEVNGSVTDFRIGSASINQSFSTILDGTHELRAQEEQSEDDETAHTIEIVSVLELDGKVFAQDVSTRGFDTVALRTRPADDGGVRAANFTVLAANDLGMHCADLDYQIFSILPPFNVVHAQVIQRGTANTPPQVLDDTAAEVVYSATSSLSDPAGSASINTTSRNSSRVFKTNFWEDSEIALPPGVPGDGANFTQGGRAYSPLYPGVQVIGPLGGPDLTGLCGNAAQEASCPSALTLFEPLPTDVGIPVPDPAELFPETGPPLLVTDQQRMPGRANVPQHFDRFDRDLPFFVDFPFGSRVQERNWFAADGVPIMPVDDNGRPNAYPLMKVSARDSTSGAPLASLDVVLPVASEADCQNCHVVSLDCLDPDLPANVQSDTCIGAAVEQTTFDVITLDDDPPGDTRLEQLLNTAKINILRLHDVKHGPAYGNWDNDKQFQPAPCNMTIPDDPNCLVNQTPIQCSRCHYSPALDLAQAGPVDEPEQGLTGRQQTRHITMSRAMHGHHGTLPDFEGQPLFPPMPGPVGRNAREANQVLEQTCYQCHPGKRTQCLRGAMFSGGVVCQDCHGDMEQVGNDFSLRVATNNPGDFVLDGSLRVPWATEPGCQSCHTGDALQKNHPPDAVVADDGIRLLQAFKTESRTVADVAEPVKVASLIKAPTSRFAENQAENASGEIVDVLYRLSTDKHAGIMCEGCHNSTHAVWPNQNPFANDNVASNQLQGHSGTLIECTTCHEAGSLGLTLDGPHGMHPVGDANWVRNHEDFLEDNSTDTCKTCHGVNGEGTVLAAMATTRRLECDESDFPGCSKDADGTTRITLQKATQVRCDTCHENKINED